jgi:hypothetical protein
MWEYCIALLALSSPNVFLNIPVLKFVNIIMQEVKITYLNICRFCL